MFFERGTSLQLSQKLRRSINFTSGSFAFAPFQLFQHMSCSAISQVQTSTMFGMLRICFLFITPPAALGPIAISFTFLSSVSSNKLGLPSFLKVGLATLHLAFQEFTVLLKLYYAKYLDENFLIADLVPQTFAYMPTSLFIAYTIFVFLQQSES